MRAILVSVDYADVLAVTLPYNRHHFTDVWVVTTPDDRETQSVAAENGAHVFTTTSFYDDGADFNKWKALEQGFDAMGREGILALMDADVMWPKRIAWQGEGRIGYLYTPLRRMCLDPSAYLYNGHLQLEEREWNRFPIHHQMEEFAGYTQIFHADDPMLGKTPWHEVNWRHAGGADSFFQAKWPKDRKVRPSFQVLHLGPAGKNWCGRVTPTLDGRTSSVASDRARKLSDYLFRRRTTRGFGHEKL